MAVEWIIAGNTGGVVGTTGGVVRTTGGVVRRLLSGSPTVRSHISAGKVMGLKFRLCRAFVAKAAVSILCTGMAPSIEESSCNREDKR